MLTSKTLKKLQLEQKKLDEAIWKNYCQRNNFPADKNAGETRDSSIRIKIALFVEIGELANELKTFKHWKSQKDINQDKVKEELIDCLHFYLSWANSFQIDFSDYKFKKLVSDPDYNNLLLALFSETEAFSLNAPLKVIKPKILANCEKTWENQISKLNPDDKDYDKNLKYFRKVKEETRKEIEKISNSFLTEIAIEKNKAVFYRWLIIFEEICQKLGMKNEKDIVDEYMKKNKINWERQQKKY